MTNKVFNRATDARTVLNSFYAGSSIDGKALATGIKAIAATGKKLDVQMHATAVACLVSSMPMADGGHLNATPAAQLLNAMPKGSRAKALAAWFEAFSNIVLKKDKEGAWVAKLTPPTQKNYKALTDKDVQAALDKPFWSVDEKDTDPKAFLLGPAIAKLLKMAEQHLAEMSDADKAALADLRGIQTKLVSQPVDKELQF